MSQTLKQILDKRTKIKNDYIRMGGITVGQSSTSDESKMIVEGIAVVFDQPTVLFEYEDEYGNTVQIKEVIEKGALDHADASDCFFKYNHSNHVMAMARVKNNTLKLEIRDEGLHIRAELADTTAGRDLYTLVKRGDIDKMSFAFNIDKEEFDQAENMFRVKAISKLWDVAPVNVPAYEGTSIYARRLEDVEALRAKQVEALEAKKRQEEEAKRQELRSKIEAKVKRAVGGQ